MVGQGDEEVRGGPEVKLSEALKNAQKAYDDADKSDPAVWALKDLIDAVEETLLARQKEADVILGLAELRRWGGSE